MHRVRSFRSSYFLGWAVVAVVAAAIAMATVVLARGAVGGESTVAALSPADVSAQLSAAATAGDGSQLADPGATIGPPSTHAPTPGSSAGGHQPAGGATTGPSSPGSKPSPHPSATNASGSKPPSSSPAPSPTQSSVTRLLTSAGGSVVARCSGSGGNGQVYLVSWSPAQGYTVNAPRDRGPAEEVEIEFESDSTSLTVHIHCSSSGPVQSVETGAGWGGGGGGGGDD